MIYFRKTFEIKLGTILQFNLRVEPGPFEFNVKFYQIQQTNLIFFLKINGSWDTWSPAASILVFTLGFILTDRE